MAYIPIDVKDRVVSGDDKYYIVDLPDGRKQLVPSPDSKTEEGTDVNRALLMHIQQGIQDNETAINTKTQELHDLIISHVEEETSIFAYNSLKVRIGGF